jgi:hypothetical protein
MLSPALILTLLNSRPGTPSAFNLKKPLELFNRISVSISLSLGFTTTTCLLTERGCPCVFLVNTVSKKTVSFLKSNLSFWLVLNKSFLHPNSAKSSNTNSDINIPFVLNMRSKGIESCHVFND